MVYAYLSNFISIGLLHHSAVAPPSVAEKSECDIQLQIFRFFTATRWWRSCAHIFCHPKEWRTKNKHLLLNARWRAKSVCFDLLRVSVVVNFRLFVIIAELWRPNSQDVEILRAIFAFLEKQLLMLKISTKFCSECLHGDTDWRCCVQMSQICPTGNGWNHALFTWQKTTFRPPLQLSLLRGSHPKSAWVSP